MRDEFSDMIQSFLALVSAVTKTRELHSCLGNPWIRCSRQSPQQTVLQSDDSRLGHEPVMPPMSVPRVPDYRATLSNRDSSEIAALFGAEIVVSTRILVLFVASVSCFVSGIVTI